jgi:hypothetical protein
LAIAGAGAALKRLAFQAMNPVKSRLTPTAAIQSGRWGSAPAARVPQRWHQAAPGESGALQAGQVGRAAGSGIRGR